MNINIAYTYALQVALFQSHLPEIPARPYTLPLFQKHTPVGELYVPSPNSGSSLLAVQSNGESLKQKLYSPVVTLYPTHALNKKDRTQ